ncbi:DUF4354 family protein, partial [Pseudomonas aeruginosa]
NACQRRAASRITKRCCRGTAHQLLPLLPEKTRPPGRGLWSGYEELTADTLKPGASVEGDAIFASEDDAVYGASLVRLSDRCK